MTDSLIKFSFISILPNLVIEKILKKYINTFSRAVSSVGRAIPF